MIKIVYSNKEQCSKSKSKGKNTKQEQTKHGPPQKNGGRIRCYGRVSIPCSPVTPALLPLSYSNSENGTRKSVDNSRIYNGLTISMKNVSQHSSYLKIVFDDKVFVSTV